MPTYSANVGVSLQIIHGDAFLAEISANKERAAIEWSFVREALARCSIPHWIDTIAWREGNSGGKTTLEYWISFNWSCINKRFLLLDHTSYSWATGVCIGLPKLPSCYNRFVGFTKACYYYGKAHPLIHQSTGVDQQTRHRDTHSQACESYLFNSEYLQHGIVWQGKEWNVTEDGLSNANGETLQVYYEVQKNLLILPTYSSSPCRYSDPIFDEDTTGG